MAAKKETFRVKAGPDAPDAVAHGNLEAEKVNGHYTTDNARFAEFLTERYGAGNAATPAENTKEEDVNNG